MRTEPQVAPPASFSSSQIVIIFHYGFGNTLTLSPRNIPPNSVKSFSILIQMPGRNFHALCDVIWASCFHRYMSGSVFSNQWTDGNRHDFALTFGHHMLHTWEGWHPA